VFLSQQETMDDASAKFFDSDKMAHVDEPERCTLSYKDAKQLAQTRR